MNLSFSGCGFLCIYHAGVAAAIREYAPELTLNKVSGASAGAIAGAGLLCGVCLGQATSDILKVVIQARSRALGALSPSFDLLLAVRNGLSKTLPQDAHLICTGKLRISLTRFSDGENVIVSRFDSREELIQAIICSCFIPFYCGSVPPSFRGVRYIDGGWSDNQPSVDEHTITVSPFSGESDICPLDWDSGSFLTLDLGGTSIRCTSGNLYRLSVALFPPHPEVCSRMCRQGFDDALRFLAHKGLVSCTRCIAVRSCITISEDNANSETVDDLLSDTHRPGRRQRSVSECQSCQETKESARRSKVPLPTSVQKTLEDAEATERSIFGRLFVFRPWLWFRLLATPWLLPIEMTYVVCKRLLRWIPTISEAHWLIDKSTRLVLSEIQNQRNLYSARFACQLAITEMNYKCTEEASVRNLASSELEIEHNFGFSVDLDAQSKPMQRLAELRRMDSYSIAKKAPPASDFLDVASRLERAGLMATDLETESGEEFRTFEHVLDYADKHNALLSYYYLDDDNKMKVCEIFDVDLPENNILPSCSRCSLTVNDNEDSKNGHELLTLADSPPIGSCFSPIDDAISDNVNHHQVHSPTIPTCCSLRDPTTTTNCRRNSVSSIDRRPLATPSSSYSNAGPDEKFFVPGLSKRRCLSEQYDSSLFCTNVRMDRNGPMDHHGK